MKERYKKTLLGSIFTFILGTSCCWLTSLAVWLGGATFLTVLSSFVESYKSIILGVAFLFLMVAIYQFWKYKLRKGSQFFLIILTLLISNLAIYGQGTLDHKSQVLGKWKTHDSRAIIEIYKQEEKYFGKIVWLQIATDNSGKLRTDKENPNPKFRHIGLIGLIVMANFDFDDNAFINGTLYDPDSGGTYNCKLWLTDNNTLKVRDYCGVLYKTFTWKRLNEL